MMSCNKAITFKKITINNTRSIFYSKGTFIKRTIRQSRGWHATTYNLLKLFYLIKIELHFTVCLHLQCANKYSEIIESNPLNIFYKPNFQSKNLALSVFIYTYVEKSQFQQKILLKIHNQDTKEVWKMEPNEPFKTAGFICLTLNENKKQRPEIGTR